MILFHVTVFVFRRYLQKTWGQAFASSQRLAEDMREDMEDLGDMRFSYNEKRISPCPSGHAMQPLYKVPRD